MSFRKLQTNIVVVIFSIIAIAGGATIIAVQDPTHFLSSFLQLVAAALIAAGVLGFLAQLGVERTIAQEVAESLPLSGELVRMGVDHIYRSTKDFEDGFKGLISTASKVDIIFVDNSRWLAQHMVAIETMLNSRGGLLRVLIPARDRASPVRQELFQRFATTTEAEFHTRLDDTYNVLKNLQDRNPVVVGGKRREPVRGVVIKEMSVAPTYSLYRIDQAAVIRVFEVQKAESEIHPVLVIASGGELWRFITDDFEALFRR